MLLRILNISCLVSLSLITMAKTYYVSATGNDNNTGLSKSSAWRSLEKINRAHFTSGDSILLEGGSVFQGQLYFDKTDAGSVKKPVFVGSFGKGKSTIEAGAGTGILFYNCAGIKISNLILIGSGVEFNKGSGIHFLTDEPKLNSAGIKISECEARGFHDFGFLFQSDKDSLAGYSNVQIDKCMATENGEAGIGSLAVYPFIQHRNIRVLKCTSFLNRGILAKTENHSGNGIVLSGVNGFLIDQCEAYENGKDCRSTGGGPVGIWVWHSTNGTITRSSSHNNYSGTCVHDGGGFDIDGGSSNCIISNCISFENEGAGYLICEFGSPNLFANHVVENNKSRDDGLKNGYGAITISGAGNDYPVTKTIIRRNIIEVGAKKAVNGTPSAIYLNEQAFSDIRFENNQVSVLNGAFVLRVDSLLREGQASFLRNKIETDKGDFNVKCEKCIVVDTVFWKTLFVGRKK